MRRACRSRVSAWLPLEETVVTADPRYFDEHVETMARPDLERLQEARLLRLIPYVYERSALIRQGWQQGGIAPKDIRSLQDFQDQVPFIQKSTGQRYRDEQAEPARRPCRVGPSHLPGI